MIPADLSCSSLKDRSISSPSRSLVPDNGKAATGQEIERALNRVKAAFPFSGYMAHAQCACVNIATVVRRHLPAGSKLLDYGAGPCDKTAVLSLLGYDCTAVDDLNDEWHMA